LVYTYVSASEIFFVSESGFCYTEDEEFRRQTKEKAQLITGLAGWLSVLGVFFTPFILIKNSCGAFDVTEIATMRLRQAVASGKNVFSAAEGNIEGTPVPTGKAGRSYQSVPV